MDRCYRKTHRHYSLYGGRGITICEEWHNPTTFVEWGKKGYQPGLTIDRRDNDGNYEPGNCRWITMKEQGNNRRDSRKITFRGQTKTVTQWSMICGVDRAALYYRIKVGWPVEKALETPSQRPKQ